MASAKVTLACSAAPDEVVDTEVTIVGGGICGILAAKDCTDRRWPYLVLDRNEELGGVWSTLANRHSYLQAYEPNYRWDERYRLSQDEMSKGSGLAVQHNLKKYAFDHAIDRFTRYSTEVLTIRQQPGGSFLTVCRNTKTGKVAHIRSAFLVVCPGILAQQYTFEERGVKDLDKFKGVLTYGGKHNGFDCAVGTTDLTGKSVVIMGTGSFALEAMEAAGRSGAAKITLVSRPRQRWVLPFSRQFTISVWNFMPLVPWPLKIRLVMWYLRKFFFEPVGLGHMPPTGRLDEQDWSGQCNDGLFRLAAEKRLEVKVGQVARTEARSVVLEDGTKLPADMFVCAAGCHYNLEPSFMSELGVGFRDLYNYCFMGRNPRIGTASDFVFAYVPFGPQKQLEMFFHAAEQIKAGREQEVLDKMIPTPLGSDGKGNHSGGRMAGNDTWFAYRHWWSTKNIGMENRLRSYFAIMGIGRSLPYRILMRVAYELGMFAKTFSCAYKGIQEMWRFPVYGPGVRDHYHPLPSLVISSSPAAAALAKKA